jgi:DNA polymerase-1
VNSHPQLEAYFRQHGLLEVFRRGDSYSFDRDQLSRYHDRHPAIHLIRVARRVLDLEADRIITGGLVGMDGRVHPDHRQLGTHTGRQSSSWPNVLGLGRVFRPLIVPQDGRGIGEVDLSQIEIGIAAAVYRDPQLLRMFNSDDVYSSMAQQFFSKRLTDEDRGLDSREFKSKHRPLREQMKVCTLGIIYGLTAHGVAGQLGISVSEAEALLRQFLSMFPVLQANLDRTVQTAQLTGYASTSTGLRRYRAKKLGPLTNWERNWIKNHPVQGTAAAIFKVAGNRLDRLYQRYDAWLLLAVHDAFVFEAPLDCLEQVVELTDRVMRESVEEFFPQLRPRTETNFSRPACWNKDGRDDSIERWIEDPMFKL